MRFCLCVGVVVAVAVSASAAVAEDLAPAPKEVAQKIGEALTKAAAGIEKPQVKIEGDPAKAVGVIVPEHGGLLLVPPKGMGEDHGLDMTGEKGVPLGLFFSSADLMPIVDGKLLDRGKLHTLAVTDGQGNKHEVNCMLLSVRKLSDEDYRLYGFGKAGKPLIDAKFTGGKGPGAKPVAMEVKVPEAGPAEVVITVFDKYQAKFQGGVVE